MVTTSCSIIGRMLTIFEACSADISMLILLEMDSRRLLSIFD